MRPSTARAGGFGGLRGLHPAFPPDGFRNCSLAEQGEGDDMISDWTEVAETFDAMGLHENLLRGIYAYGT